MLVTNAEAEGSKVELDGHTLTFYFPTAEPSPVVQTVDGAAVVGGAEGGLDRLGVTDDRDLDCSVTANHGRAPFMCPWTGSA